MAEGTLEAGHEGHFHPHGHHHAHAAAGPSSVRRMAISLAAASAIMVAEAVGGWLSGSLALLSDAGHMLTDVAALGLALLAMLFAARPADQKRTFGFRRLEVLAAQINVVTLVGLTGWIAYEALDRLHHPPASIGLGAMGVVAAIGVVGNTFILYWLRHDHGLNARSAFLHVLGDAVASVGVLGGALVMWLVPGTTWIDPVLSLGIALLILWGAIRIVAEITEILMEAVPRHLDVGAVCQTMEGVDGVVEVHDLHIWTISSGLHALSAHLVIDAGSMGSNDRILTDVKSRLHKQFGIDHTTIQIESAAYAHVDDVHVH
jgi:cobalt-zinc-cadmium efflux system protein